MATAPLASRTTKRAVSVFWVVTGDGETPVQRKVGGLVSILTVTCWGVSWLPALSIE